MVKPLPINGWKSIRGVPSRYPAYQIESGPGHSPRQRALGQDCSLRCRYSRVWRYPGVSSLSRKKYVLVGEMRRWSAKLIIPTHSNLLPCLAGCGVSLNENHGSQSTADVADTIPHVRPARRLCVWHVPSQSHYWGFKTPNTYFAVFVRLSPLLL
jgi:hypothetical protein